MPRLVGRVPSLASLPGDFSSQQILSSIAVAVEDLFEEICRNSTDIEAAASALDELSLELLDEIHSLRAVSAGAYAGRISLQLTVANAPLRMWCLLGRLDRAWRWAVACAMDEVPEGEQVELDLMIPFRAGGLGQSSQDLALVWVGQMCFLAFSGGYLYKEASIVASIAAPDLVNRLTAKDYFMVEPSCHVAALLHQIGDPQAKALLRQLELVWNDADVDTETKAQVGLLLSSAPGELTSIAPRVRAEQALGQQGSSLEAHQRLHLLVAAVSHDAASVRGHLEKLISAIEEHNRHLDSVGASDMAARFIRARKFDVLAPAVRVCLLDGDSRTAVSLLSAWSDVSSDSALDNALVCARLEEEIVWAYEGAIVRTTGFNSETAAGLSQGLGLTPVDRTEPTRTLAMPERPGVPDHSRAEQILDLTRGAFSPEECGSLSTAAAKAGHPIVNLAFERAPLAHAISAHGGPLLPTAISMGAPADDRTIRLAHLWYRSDLLLAAEEAKAVAEILRNAGVTVQIHDAAEQSKEEFLASYRDPDVDLLWIASHAEFGLWNPDRTSLALAESVFVTMEELASPPTSRPGRRLLVLNACDTGAVAALGGPSSVGIGGVAAGSKQAVISHLWPTRWWAAAAFGALLAAELTKTSSFVDAFGSASTALAGDAAGALYSSAPQDLAQRLEWKVTELTYLDCASACFFQ